MYIFIGGILEFGLTLLTVFVVLLICFFLCSPDDHQPRAMPLLLRRRTLDPPMLDAPADSHAFRFDVYIYMYICKYTYIHIYIYICIGVRYRG